MYSGKSLRKSGKTSNTPDRQHRWYYAKNRTWFSA